MFDISWWLACDFHWKWKLNRNVDEFIDDVPLPMWFLYYIRYQFACLFLGVFQSGTWTTLPSCSVKWPCHCCFADSFLLIGLRRMVKFKGSKSRWSGATLKRHARIYIYDICISLYINHFQKTHDVAQHICTWVWFNNLCWYIPKDKFHHTT